MVDGFMQNSSTSRPARNSAEVRFSKYSEYSFQAQYAPQRDKGEYICLDSLLCKTRKKDGQKHNNNVMAICRTVMYIPATVLVKDPEGLPDVLLEVGLLQLLGHHGQELVEVDLPVTVNIHLLDHVLQLLQHERMSHLSLVPLPCFTFSLCYGGGGGSNAIIKLVILLV